MIGRRLMAAGALFLLAAVWAGPAPAAVTEDNFQLRNVGDLIAVCSADPSDPLMTAAVNFCQGFAVGVFRTLEDEQAAMETKLFCIPGRAPTRSEAIARFDAWAQSHPDMLQAKPEDGILAYLRERFPCAPRR